MIIDIIIIFLLISATQTSKYNVVFIVIDDLRPALGVYGDSNAYTPNIDKLATSSFVFKNAYAQQSLCAPSRNSFLTSRRPDTLQLYDFYSYWRNSVGNFTTLPQHFKNNGYITHSVGKVFHPGISSNFTDDYPISWSRKPFHPKSQAYKNAKVCLDKDGNYGTNIVCPVRVEDHPCGTLPDLEVLDESLKFLKEVEFVDDLFFLAVGFQKPHIPLKYPRKYLAKHLLSDIVTPSYTDKPAYMPTVAWNPWNDMRLRDDIQQLNISFPFGKIPQNYTKEIIQSYAASVTYIDDLVGELLKNVNLQRTVVVLVGDHGVSMGEHGEFSKYSNFDVATRVPLIIYVPNMTESMITIDHAVELLDIFPTLIDITIVSGQIPPCNPYNPRQKLCTEGKSLLSDMINSKYRRSSNIAKQYVAVSQYPRPSVYPSQHPDSDKPKLKQIKIMGYSLKTSCHRYTEWVAFNPRSFVANWTHVYAKELYNHLIDPDENMNLASYPEMQSIIEDLHDQLLNVLHIQS